MMDPLVSLARLTSRQAADLEAAVVVCREAGCSWARIGPALGLSKSQAHARYRHVDSHRATNNTREGTTTC